MGCAERSTPQAWLINDQASLHLHHGPIDLVITASGSEQAVQTAFAQAHSAFQTILQVLADELIQLRTPVANLEQRGHAFKGPVARRMAIATRPYRSNFVTPMAAVAGAVADHVMHAATVDNRDCKLLVNNGGDIAIHLQAGQSCRVGICTSPESATYSDITTVHANDPVAGVATSGWKGRSHSLGIADAVTVLASDAARADVAATLIANEVNLPQSPRIRRQPASTLQPDSDLQDRLVTVAVEKLGESDIELALAGGVRAAQQMLQRGLIHSAYIHLQQVTRVVTGSPTDIPVMAASDHHTNAGQLH
jgi:ApbE superfamily uncharacterized protein (UPF0280 family)